MLLEVGVDIFSKGEWHNRANQFPKALMCVCSIADIFREIGNHTQDSLVGIILAEAKKRASVLKKLECLNDAGALTKRQEERFVDEISKMDISAIRSAGLHTKACFDKLINAMETQNWYSQNPAIDLVVSNGAKQAAELSKDQQVELGRNILQAGEGGARSANEFLHKLPDEMAQWPIDVIRGIVLESFTNEDDHGRVRLTV